MRKRRVAKWVGTVMCVLILAIGVVSMFWGVGFFKGISVSCARVTVYAAPWDFQDISAWRLEFFATTKQRLGLTLSKPVVGFSSGNPGDREFFFPTEFVYILANAPQRCFVRIPLWLPLFLIAVPTTFLWWRDRRHLPTGHCQKCGYDLTGNVSGRCPECGAAIPQGGDTT